MVPVGDIYLIYFTYPTLYGIFFMEVVLMDEATKNTPMLFAYSMGDNFSENPYCSSNPYFEIM